MYSNKQPIPTTAEKEPHTKRGSFRFHSHPNSRFHTPNPPKRMQGFVASFVYYMVYSDKLAFYAKRGKSGGFTKWYD